MQKLLIFILAILIGGAALLIGGKIVLVYLSPFSHMKAGIIITPSPVSLELAEKNCPISLPRSARNIQYGVWSLWQASMTYVRFEAPVDDCLKHAEKVLNEHVLSYNLTGVSIVTNTDFQKPQNPGTPTKDFDVSWFDVEAISGGIQFELKSDPNGVSSPIIYVDKNRGVFYYRYYD
jgi:hypothetical protein